MLMSIATVNEFDGGMTKTSDSFMTAFMTSPCKEKIYICITKT